jgi:hypothetical protein
MTSMITSTIPSLMTTAIETMTSKIGRGSHGKGLHLDVSRNING